MGVTIFHDMTPIIIATHAIAASIVLLVGPIQVIRRRKDLGHRILGRSWVVCIYLTCVTGMFIYTLTGGFTIFHALALFTLCTSTLGVIHIRHGRKRQYAISMIGTYLGACTAGAFAIFVPGRVIPTLAVHDPAVLWGVAAAIAVACTVWIVVVLGFLAPRKTAVARSLRGALSRASG